MLLSALLVGLAACAPAKDPSSTLGSSSGSSVAKSMPPAATPLASVPTSEPAPDAPARSSALPIDSLVWTTPPNHVLGESFPVQIRARASKGQSFPIAWTTPEGFLVNGQPLGSADGTYDVAFDQEWGLSFDLGPYLNVEGDFTLALAGEEAAPRAVKAWRKAPAGTDFLNMGPDELAKWNALLRTNRGDMVAAMWPDVAPKHVRNYLDLCATGFYDGILFHRCIPTFVIQGGDPQTKNPDADKLRFGMGNGPRKIDAEFSTRPHERGTLSAARLGNDVNSATSQFFVCHQRVPTLDGSYSAFGTLLSGLEVLDAIVTSPKDIDVRGTDPRTGQPQRVPSDRPLEPQRIEHAWVVQPAGK